MIRATQYNFTSQVGSRFSAKYNKLRRLADQVYSRIWYCRISQMRKAGFNSLRVEND